MLALLCSKEEQRGVGVQMKTIVALKKMLIIMG